MVESGQRFVVLAEIQIGIAQAHLQFRIIRREGCGFLQLRRSFGVFVPLGVHCAQASMSELV